MLKTQVTKKCQIYFWDYRNYASKAIVWRCTNINYIWSSLAQIKWIKDIQGLKEKNFSYKIVKQTSRIV
jgi:hypothetical protein